MKESVITYTEICKAYPAELGARSNIAMNKVSFELSKGETLGLVGANGAGKSTCIHLLMNFIHPDSGEITISGLPVTNSVLRNTIGYLPEVASFPANLTVLDMLRFAGTACGLSAAIIRLRSESLLKELELWGVKKRPLHSYSKGMQQRASFAVALIGDPDLLILDEPMSGLDPVGREKIIALIQRLKQQGKTILFCSHILEDVHRLADRLLVLHKGEKLFDGTVEQICAQEHVATMTEAFLSIIQGDDAKTGAESDGDAGV